MDQSSGGSPSSPAAGAGGLSGDGEGSIVVGQQRGTRFQVTRMQNPFTFKVGQVFTGFGVGCGVGIGVGRPINMGAIPVVNQVMSATRGVTDAFSGVTRHVNDALRKVGAKNIEAGVGCGVGFGHGFGVGVALKPGVINQIHSGTVQLMMKMMSKFGLGTNLPINPGALSGSFRGATGMNLMSGPLSQSPIGNTQSGTKSVDNTFCMAPGNGSMGYNSHQSGATSSPPYISMESRTEKVLTNFLQNPVLEQDDDAGVNDMVESLRSENKVLQMVLKHQQIIDELREENEKLRQILLEDLKVPPSKIEQSYSTRHKSLCMDCFECRRKERRRR